MRYEHYLAPAKGASYPAQVVAVECTGRFRPINNNGTIEVEELTSWHCATMHGTKGSYGKVKTWSGDNSQSLWDSLKAYSDRGALTYVLLWRAQRILSMLSFWTQLENGQLRLCGSDARDCTQKRSRWRSQTSGVCILEDPPTVIQCRAHDSKGTMVFVDVRNYGIDRDTMPSDPEAWCGEILTWFRAASRCLVERKLGGWKTTGASQAFHSWRYKHLKHSVLCHTVSSALSLERRAYYGGRCECFKIGSYKGPIYHLDFRSLYPFCCLSDELPVRLIGCWQDYQAIPRGVLAGEPALIADVTLRTDSASYPCRKDGRILWPIGKFRTALCGPELRDAEQTQRIVKYHCLAAYETSPALREWVKDWYAIREDADRTRDKLLGSWAKRVLVALVGKLGQREPLWLPAANVVPDGPWESYYAESKDGTASRYRTFNWQVQREQINPNGPDSVPALAGWITSLARMRLLEALRVAGRRNVYYCDTDSLICNARGHLLLSQAGWIRRGELGYLQERGIHDTIDLLNVKHYALDGEIKCSGMPQGPLSEGPTAGTLWYHLHCRSALRQSQAPSATRQLRSYKREDVYEIGRVTQWGEVIPIKIGG